MALVSENPNVIGSKRDSVLVKAGPASYTQVTVASPPTGGQSAKATEFGMKYIEHIQAALSDDGQYFVYATPASAGDKPCDSWILMWVTASGGAEVAGTTDLSGRVVRLRAVGI